MDTIFDGEVPRARLALLLRHFSELKDNREPWRIVYPLQEVLLLVTCATIASCDDFDDIVAWGKHHLAFLRHFSEFHHGIPCERWLRALLNRIDPILFGRCFNSWIAAKSRLPTRSLLTRPITCSPSGATNPRSKPMSRTISAPPPPTNLSAKPPSRRDMAGSRRALTPPPARSTG